MAEFDELFEVAEQLVEAICADLFRLRWNHTPKKREEVLQQFEDPDVQLAFVTCGIDPGALVMGVRRTLRRLASEVPAGRKRAPGGGRKRKC